MITIKQLWEDYQKHCYGDRKLSDTQFSQVRQAFYGGAFVLLNHLNDELAKHSDEDGAIIIDKLNLEMVRFMKQQLERLRKQEAKRN